MEGLLALLSQGEYRAAFDRLVAALDRAKGKRRAELALALAEFYALYGAEEGENLAAALDEAAHHPEIARSERFRALAELDHSYTGGAPKAFTPRDPVAAYYLALALFEAGDLEGTLALLERATPLPRHLAWRADALAAAALAEGGRFEEAVRRYRAALPLAPAGERGPLALDAAEAALEAGRPEEARDLLRAHAPLLAAPEQAASLHYLLARAELALGNPRRALSALEEAEQKEREAEDESYGVPLLKGQALMQTGAYADAEAAFRRALALAPPEERSFVAHELAVAALEAGDLAEAERLLKEVFADPDYAHRGAAAADLAELYYRLAELEASRLWAEEAIRLGEAASGELFLGHVAYDRMRLDEALAHYRRAAELAPEGSRDWLVAEQTITEILAQQGYPEPEEVLRRAEAALRYTPPSDDWASALRLYAERARALLAGGRTLN